MRASREEESEFEIPMTPLIDVVFLLLIFFLVATNFTRKEVDQKVKLPTAEGGAKKRVVPENMVINIRPGGTIVVAEKITSFAELRPMLKKWHAANPKGTVEIRGDAAARYEYIIKVFGLCSAEKIVNVTLPTRPLPATGGSAGGAP